MKAECGKTAVPFERRTEASPSMGASSDPTAHDTILYSAAKMSTTLEEFDPTTEKVTCAA